MSQRERRGAIDLDQGRRFWLHRIIRLERFRAKRGTGSRKENALRQEIGAPVLIQSEPERL
jgi:hypothetical protein